MFEKLGYCEGCLLVFSETHINVIECKSGNWIQTINVKKCRPLNESGILSLCVLNDQNHFVYLAGINESNFELNNIFFGAIFLLKKKTNYHLNMSSRQSSEEVTISCGTRVSKIPKYLDTYKESTPTVRLRF